MKISLHGLHFIRPPAKRHNLFQSARYLKPLETELFASERWNEKGKMTEDWRLVYGDRIWVWDPRTLKVDVITRTVILTNACARRRIYLR